MADAKSSSQELFHASKSPKLSAWSVLYFLRTVLCVIILLISSVLFFTCVSVVWLLRKASILSKRASEVGYAYSSTLFYTVPTVYMFEVFGGAQIIYSGDKIPDGEGAIVFGNHVSNCDSVFILGLLLRKGLSGSLHFMAKKTLMYFPFIGWSFKIAKLGVFMSRNWDQDREHIEKSFEAITDSEIPCCMGLMPEGTRITEKKRQDAIQFCNGKNIEPLNQVLVPRPRGFRAVVNSLRKSNIKYIYDFTFCYIDGVVRIRDFVFSSIRGRRILVNIKRIPLDQVPQDDQGIQNWLLDRFRRKDKLIAGAAKSKQFEGETKQSEPLRIQIITKTKKQ